MNTVNRLINLDKRLEQLNVLPKTRKSWGGAGVVIAEVYPSTNSGCFYGKPRYVVTKHALELSWVFGYLKNAFNAENLINCVNKYEFYGRLANAAIRVLKNNKDASAHELCMKVLDEAFEIYAEIKNHVFDYLLVACGNEIVDDYVG